MDSTAGGRETVGAVAPASGPFTTLVVPVDFSAPSDRSLAYAIDLAVELGARIVLVHALHIPPELPPSAPWWGELSRRAQRGLQQLQKDCEARGVQCEARVCEERAVDEGILNVVREVGADLIVMATRGHSPIRHLLLGSVTERMLHRSPCPVVTIRESVAS